MDKGIVLMSGGLDSTLTLAKLAEYDEVVPLFVNYNQWPLIPEKEAVESLCKFLGCQDPVIAGMQIEGDINQIGSVWGRSIAMLGVASMWAYTHGDDYSYIALGSHEGDVGPDCKPGDFDYWMGKALNSATKNKMDIKLPIADYSIEDIGKELAQYTIPFELTYSCYWFPPCGYKSVNEEYRCPGCRRKAIAIRSAGITDENFLDFPNGNLRGRTYQSSMAVPAGY